VVPANYKDYVKYTKAYETHRRELERCKSAKKDCHELERKSDEATTALMDFTAKQKAISKKVEDAFGELKDSGAKIQSFTISGHDGGGHFGGLKGTIDRERLSAMLSRHPEINEVKSLLLLGCYTGVQKEILSWKNIFPQVKLIAGYDGSAPLADRPQGHQYLFDLLMKEKNLLIQSEEKKLEKYIKNNIRGLESLNSAFYLSCTDEKKEKEFYYRSLPIKSLTSFDTKECLEKRDEIEAIIAELNSYDSGEKEPPKDTSNGELRKLYNKARRYEHCGDLLGLYLDLNAVFNLLFYEGVKENFGAYYKDDLAQAEAIIKELDIEELLKTIGEKNHLREESISELENKLKLLKKKASDVQAHEDYEALKKLDAERNEIVFDPAYLPAVAKLKDLETLEPKEGVELTETEKTLLQKDFAIVEKLRDLEPRKEKLEKELIALEGEMRFLEKDILYKKQELGKSLLAAASLRKQFREIWVPTADQLESHSRAETLQNVHRLSGILTNPDVPPRQRKALEWVGTVVEQHLQHFQNPFSWHEFTGRVERPATPVTLREVLERPDTVSYSSFYQPSIDFEASSNPGPMINFSFSEEP
jgi:hypothetical protein